MKLLNTNKGHAIIFLIAIVVFTVVGLIAGSPVALSYESFGDFLRGFASDAKTRMIFVTILADVSTGVMAALRMGIFDLGKVAKFYTSNILPYMLGFMLFWTVAYTGLDLPEFLNNMIASLGYSMIMANLAGSIMDNINRTRMGVASPVDGVTIAPIDDDPLVRG